MASPNIGHQKNLRCAFSQSKRQRGKRGKAQLRVAKCHEHYANARHDFRHKLSRQLVDENQAVIVETLKSSNMLKNRRLAKHIVDVS
ncbi:hypothetical protein C5470_18635 [Photorhabdus stackebrandtii]|uniref:Probable transposase IS891/IS1136/IS1341 domain-containing protein n=1 Tax=Photorhabdus stackebrandtii TaxID=1123042 RepID=A0A7X5TLQ2_9GAMM|nr:hypothetical protein [Photorhabdus stackebrandtii]